MRKHAWGNPCMLFTSGPLTLAGLKKARLSVGYSEQFIKLGPRFAQNLSLLQHRLQRSFLLVRYVFVLLQNQFHRQVQLGMDASARQEREVAARQ
jgi:hypothetical protein